MKEKKNHLHKEPGSAQRQTQKNEDVRANKIDQYGIVLVSKAKQEKIGQKNQHNKFDKAEPDLNHVDDEKVISGIRAKRSSWNSIDFETDDFFGGLLPA